MDSLHTMLEGYWVGTEMATNIVILMNIIGASMLGLIVGYERSYRGRAAGMRTYAFVCMASCALTVISGYPGAWFGGHASFGAVTDPGRIIQGIVTGIGFLGAGVIMRDGLNISGLTTAASIWAVAGIGILVGVGFYAAAIVLATLSAIFMMWGGKVEGWLPRRHAISLSLYFRKEVALHEKEIFRVMRELGYEVARGSYAVSMRDGHCEWRFVAVSLGKRKCGTLIDVTRRLATEDDIESFHVVHARN